MSSAFDRGDVWGEDLIVRPSSISTKTASFISLDAATINQDRREKRVSLRTRRAPRPHRAIQDVVLFAMPDDNQGVAVAAAVIPDPAKEFFRGKIGGYKIPKRLYSVEEIPINGTGKPVKHVLRRRLSDQA